MKRVTLADIANETNLSLGTISRVIHNNGYVSSKNREVIQAVIKKVGYVPNRVARGLRNQRTDFIGHVMGLRTNPLSARMSDAMHAVFDEAGYHVITAMVRDGNRSELEILEDLTGFMVEAVIFNTVTTCGDDVFRRMIAQGISVVMIERARAIKGLDFISPDSFAGACIAVRHMVDCGHKEIAFVGVDPNWGVIEKQRLDGYTHVMTENGLKPPERFIRLMPNYSVEYGYCAMEAILKSGAHPTAVFATSDLFACGVLQCVYGKGLRVPEDISVIGYDNTLAGSCAPPLSSIDMCPEQIGRAALEMILARKTDNSIDSQTRYITPYLVDRGSVSRL